MRQGIIAGIAFTILGTSASTAASFTHIACGYCNSRAISADGAVIVGNTDTDAFRWSAATGLVQLGAGFTSVATGVSGDGSIVVGSSETQFPDGNHFYRWTSSTGVQFLGRGTAEDISADGTTIVGSRFNQPFRWTNGTGLVTINSTGYAFAVSADGSVIAGSATVSPNGYPTAGRWTASTGWVNLGLLPGGTSASFPVSAATAISSGGDVIGGFSRTGVFGEEAPFLWSQDGGMAKLDVLPTNAYARNLVRGISADGAMIVGEAYTPFIWTSEGGVEDLFQFLVARGITGIDAFTNLGYIGGISPDGRFITGSGSTVQGNLEAWIVDLQPVPIPAAAWLFGGALGLLGLARRRSASPVPPCRGE